jgi:hypothetical protein
VPVPERLTDCGLPLALSANASDAERLPDADGVNSMAIVQLLPAAREEPHVLTSEKSAGSEPVKLVLVMFNVAFPVFVSVTTRDELGKATGSFPKLRLEGETLATAAPDALTVSASVALAAPPLLVALSMTEAVPVAVGVPEINPVALFTVKPPGKEVAP